MRNAIVILGLGLVACTPRASRQTTPSSSRTNPAAAKIAVVHVATPALPPRDRAESALDTWTEELMTNPPRSLLHEHDALGDWVTVLDEHGTELCMFASEVGEALDETLVAETCGWSAAADELSGDPKAADDR